MGLRAIVTACCLTWGQVVFGQTVFVDDAARSVSVPAVVNKVFAAGAPAEILLYTLAPEKLAGRNHAPSPAALEFTPPRFRNPVLISQLPDPDGPAGDRELVALQPDLYVDYGDVTADYVDSVNNVQGRTGVPAIILDGSLERIAATYRRLGVLVGARERGEQLALHTERLLEKYRDYLSRKSMPPKVYLACSADGLVPCRDGERNAEFARWLGAVNVAGTHAGRLTIGQIATLDPEVVVAPTPEAAERIRGSADWQAVAAVKRGRVLSAPALPFGWGPRPPSVNRLPGLIWLAYALPGQSFDAAFFTDVREFFTAFYQVTPSDEQLGRLVAY